MSIIKNNKVINVIELEREDEDDSEFVTFNIDISCPKNKNIKVINKYFLFFDKYMLIWDFNGGLNVDMWITYDTVRI